MRIRTIVAVVVVVSGLGGVAAFGYVDDRATRPAIEVLWVSDTTSGLKGNHHAPAVAVGESGPMVYAPISGRPDTDECELAALDGTTGMVRWRGPIPPANCTVHAVADPTVADYDRDGIAEVLVVTTENELAVYHPDSGTVERRTSLPTYGYTRPLVVDLVGDGRLETVVVDVTGTVHLVAENGTTLWRRPFDAYTAGQPAVIDGDGDGRPEIAVGVGGSGKLHLIDHTGSRVWDAPVTFDSTITWVTTVRRPDGPPSVVVATARGGTVAAVDGNGTVEWSRDLGSFAAVNAVGDGDGDGTREVYAVANDGVLRSLDARTGETEWSTTLTSATVSMMPPPSLGDVDGDGEPELVAVSNDGLVSLVDPRSGEIRSTYERADAIFTHPTLADVDGDGDVEAFVIYGSGRVVALDFERD